MIEIVFLIASILLLVWFFTRQFSLRGFIIVVALLFLLGMLSVGVVMIEKW